MSSEKNNIIPLFRNKTKLKPPSKASSDKVRPFIDRLQGLYDHAESIRDDFAAQPSVGEINGISKERCLGHFDAMMDAIDDIIIRMVPTLDDAG